MGQIWAKRPGRYAYAAKDLPCSAALCDRWNVAASAHHRVSAHRSLRKTADRMGIRIDAEQTAELEGAPVPAPVQLQAVRVVVDLHGDAVLRAATIRRPSRMRP